MPADPMELSVVVPVFNEKEGLGQFTATLRDILAETGKTSEIIFVDDGSTDQTYELIEKMGRSPASTSIKGLRFSRNFGKEAALLAGLEASSGEIVITMDADGQHPPELISEMITAWEKGAKIVHGVKTGASYDNIWTRTRARLFNSLLSTFADIDTMGSSDFKLLDRDAVEILINALPEHQRFYRGLADWMGFPCAVVRFTVRDRENGTSKWSILKLTSMAAVAIISFTSAPLRIITVLGVGTLLFGFFVSLDALISWINGKAVSGFVTLIISLLLIGSAIMISLGIIGEYIAKIYDEIKGRPVFIIQSKIGFDPASQHHDPFKETISLPADRRRHRACSRSASGRMGVRVHGNQ
ncbi:MAG: glycosyltransferase [Verrucomicrobiota bacterium]